MSSSQKIAFIVQADLQFPHPMHFCGMRMTPPPALGFKAPVGQTFAQGGSRQALQTVTMKPRSIPPADFTCIADLDKPASPNLRAQAKRQPWQPTHRLTSTTASRFIISALRSIKTQYYQYNKPSLLY